MYTIDLFISQHFVWFYFRLPFLDCIPSAGDVQMQRNKRQMNVFFREKSFPIGFGVLCSVQRPHCVVICNQLSIVDAEEWKKTQNRKLTDQQTSRQTRTCKCNLSTSIRTSIRLAAFCLYLLFTVVVPCSFSKIQFCYDRLIKCELFENYKISKRDCHVSEQRLSILHARTAFSQITLWACCDVAHWNKYLISTKCKERTFAWVFLR